MTVAFRDGLTSFVPRARLIKLLGGELIRDEVMAVTELVKNAHDADAGVVTLSFIRATGRDGVIIIEDDGCGMGAEDFIQHWMQPAGSSKSRDRIRYTSSGRRMLGEKGVGRFAVDRLGRHVELVSRAAGSETEIVAIFDWDEFDDESRLLSEIGVRWREQPAHTIERSGTRIRVTGLRMEWRERTFRRLCARLQRLLSPANRGADFRIEINSDEFPDYQGPLKVSFLERATYRIRAEFNGEDTVTCQLGAGDPTAHVWLGPGDLSCGPVNITIHCFDLETDALAKAGPPQDVRAWLREWSGISIYRDGFRVLPYGEPDDDWLRLDQRRVNNPVVRLSNNQVCGYAEIGRDANPDLRDQTNRGGLIESRAFEDLRRLVLFVLQIVEAERQAIRNPPAQERTLVSSGARHLETDLVLQELRGAVGRTRVGQLNLKALVDLLEGNLRSERAGRDSEIEGLLEVAAIGLGAGTTSHALAPRLKVLRRLLRSAHKGHEGPPTAAVLQSEKVLDEIEQTASFLGAIAPSRRAGRRTIDIGAELREFDSHVACLLPSHGASLGVSVRRGDLLRTEMPVADFHQVLHALLWNSLDWLGKQPKRKISVSAAGSNGGFCRILFKDNGSGVPPEAVDRIFSPGFSLKPNGRGMGLAIARRLLARSQATITLSSPPGKGWTTFEIVLKLKRSKTDLAQG